MTLTVPTRAERYTLSGDLRAKVVRLNGQDLALGPNDDLPPLSGARTAAGEVTFAPATITFLALPDAANGSCR